MVGSRRGLWTAVLGRSMAGSVGTMSTAQLSIERLLGDFSSRPVVWRDVALNRDNWVVPPGIGMWPTLSRLGVDPETWDRAHDILISIGPSPDALVPYIWAGTRLLQLDHQIVRKAIAALLLWPDAESLLDSTPDQVRMWATLGQPAAALMLPAVIALHTERRPA
jgi:hypothetical protein